MMNLNVFIVIRLGGGRFAANMTRIRPIAAMHPHVILQIVRTMKRLTAHVAVVRFFVFVLFDVSLTVVLADKLRPAIVARVRAQAFMRVHVRHVIALPDKGGLAHFALERFLAASCVRPLVQFQVPLGRKFLVANRTTKRFLLAVSAKVSVQRRFEVDTFANWTFGIRLQHFTIIHLYILE